jgi:hypothetical protein
VRQRAGVAKLAQVAVLEEVPGQLVPEKRTEDVAVRTKPQFRIDFVSIASVPQLWRTIDERLDAAREAVSEPKRYPRVGPDMRFDVRCEPKIVSPRVGEKVEESLPARRR